MIKANWVANAGADAPTGELARKMLTQWIGNGNYILSDSQPDIILFMTGGSERSAINMLPGEKPVLLLAIDGHNAYAAATEVMAWLVTRNRVAVLADAEAAFASGLISRWQMAVEIWESLSGKKAGLIGSVSDWLVASEVPAETLKRVFGVSLTTLPWHKLPSFGTFSPDKSLLQNLEKFEAHGLYEVAQVLTMLRNVIADSQLDAIGVECFSLVQKTKVTACLALAQLNDEGLAAACEGDLASMAGMMLAQACGTIPWMANTTKITNDSLIVSHCTAAFSLVENMSLATHFETGCSLAVKGTLAAREVTLFRFSQMLDKAFVSEGAVTGYPEMNNACRTQVEIGIPLSDLDLLRKQPLGNHLIVLPGKMAELFRLLCRYKGIAVIA